MTVESLVSHSMKQFLFLSAITLGCGLASVLEPFWGIFLYYVFAVMRPQYLWKWALPFDAHWSLIAAAIVFVSLALQFPKIIERARFNVVAGFVVAYGLMVMLTMITAYNPAWSQVWVVETGKILLMAILATCVIDELWQVNLLGVMILFSLGEIAYEVNCLYYFQNHRLDIFHYGYGGYDNNGAGLLLALAIPFAYCYFFSAAKGAWRIVKYATPVVAVLLIQAVMMTYSRGAMLASLIGLGWILLHHRKRLQAVIVVLVLMLVVGRLAGPQIRHEFMSTEDYQSDASAQVHLEAWHAAWEMTWEHPLFGTGVRNSKYFMKNYDWRVRGRTVHNIYLQTAADSGVITASIYIAMLIAAMAVLSLARRDCLVWLREEGSTATEADWREIDRAEKLCLSIQGSLIVFAVGSMFLSVEDFETFWLLIVMAGVMPGVVRKRIVSATQPEEQASQVTADQRPQGAAAGGLPGMTGVTA